MINILIYLLLFHWRWFASKLTGIPRNHPQICATFLLLSYSKFVFVSVNFLLAVRSYNGKGESVPAATVLFYDPTVKFLHSEHIPYVILAAFVLIVFVLLPPLFLLLYPTRYFRACLRSMGLKRWDILHLVMDIFQGWFKDGTCTDNQHVDYRSFSALYLLLRILFASVFISIVLNISKIYNFYWIILGLFHVIMSVFLLVLKPYEKTGWIIAMD